MVETVLPVLLRVIRREERSVANLTALLEDPRARLLATRLTVFIHEVRVIDNLLDPPVEVDIPLALDERQVAMLNKLHLAKVRGRLASATSKLVVTLTNIMDVLFDVDPYVQTEVNLTENLGKTYKVCVESIGKLHETLSVIEATSFPDEILKATAELRKTWGDLKLKLTHQITEPLRSSLTELARENALKKLSEAIYGGGRFG